MNKNYINILRSFQTKMIEYFKAKVKSENYFFLQKPENNDF